MAAGDARIRPVRAAPYRLTFPIFDADGDLVTGAASLDSEVSKDGGTFTDCTNEATEVATSSGIYTLDLTTSEMDADTVAVIVKTGTAGAKTTPIILYTESGAQSGVAQAGAASTITLASAASATTDIYKGQRIELRGGTGKGQSRTIIIYNGSTKVATVDRNWATNPDSTTVYLVADDVGIIGVQKLEDGAITSDKIATGAIQAVNIATGAITAAKFAAGAIDAAAIADNAIDAGALAADCITAAKIANGAIDAATFAAGAIDAAALAADAAGEIADAVWDEARSGHTTAGTFGEYVLADTVRVSGDATAADNLELFFDGTGYAAANSTVGTVTTVTSVTNVTGDVQGKVLGGGVSTITGTGVTANLTSLHAANLHAGTAQAGAAGSITLASGASAVNDFYVGLRVKLYANTGVGQARTITAYNGTTKVATVDRNWVTNPDSTTSYSVESDVGLLSTDKIVDAAFANDKFAADAIQPINIADGAIQASKFAAGAINAAAIATGAITSAKFAAGAIDAAAIADSAIDAATFAAGAINAAAIATGAITAAKFAAGAIDAAAIADNAIDSATFAAGTAIPIVTTVNGLAANTLTAAAAAADLGTELADALLARQITEGYAADGSAPTVQQALSMIWSAIAEISISGTTMTCKKLDGTTTSMTFTLDSATNPTSRTRAT